MRPPHIKVGRDYLWRVHYRLQRLGRFPIWTVYRPVTREYPGSWVARIHVALPGPRPTRWVLTHDTLDGLRAILPPGLTRLERDPRDVAEIEEVWL